MNDGGDEESTSTDRQSATIHVTKVIIDAPGEPYPWNKREVYTLATPFESRVRCIQIPTRADGVWKRFFCFGLGVRFGVTGKPRYAFDRYQV